MRKFLFAIPTLLAFAAALVADPAPAPAPVHPSAAAALALVFHTPAAPVKPPAPAPAPKKTPCDCATTGVCTCGADCACPNCAAKAEAKATRPPKIGDTKVTDDPSRPWTYGYGREYGYDELGWYRPLRAAPTYAPPVMIFRGACSGGS